METITHLPLLFLDLLESKRLLSQHLGYVNEIALPFDFAIVAHVAEPLSRDRIQWVEFFLGKNVARHDKHWPESFVPTLHGNAGSYTAPKKDQNGSVGADEWLWRNIVLESAVHPFMTAVLTGLSQLDSLGTDAELDPPLRQLTDTADSQRSKGSSVVSANRLGAGHTRETPTPTRV